MLLYKKLLLMTFGTTLVYIRAQSVPRCKHSTTVIKAIQLRQYKAKVAVCSMIHTKHINAM